MIVNSVYLRKYLVRVIIFVDLKLLDVFMNWALFYYHICNNFDDLDVICMDETSAELLKLAGLSCSERSFHLKYSEDEKDKLGRIWLHRVEIITDYILSGIDVILSDSDALFLNPKVFTDISSYGQNAEFVASRAWWPWPQFKVWGACICMGFVYAKSGPFAADLFLSMREGLQQQALLNSGWPDDQIAINNLLESWNITWMDGYLSVGSNKVANTGRVIRNGTTYNVTLLPHSEYIRKCHSFKAADDLKKQAQQEVLDNVKGATVAHCRLPKGEGKLQQAYVKIS